MNQTGLFRPQSAIWKVSRETVLLLGGPAAAILQIAHPQIALGVSRHSNFREETLGRLHRTLEAVYTVTFSPRAEVEAMERRIRARHAPVKGSEPQRYSAFDPAAQMWVLATLIAVAVECYEAFVDPLTAEERESYYRDMREFGVWFGLDRSFGPANWSEFSAYYAAMLEGDELCSLPISRDLACHIAHPRQPLFLRLGWPASNWAARRFLPSPVCEKLGFRHIAAGPVDDAIRDALGLLPPGLRYARQYLRAIGSAGPP